ncbi:MAG: NAD(P)-dependent oxidoreductase [Egibacteraceae bacterium]
MRSTAYLVNTAGACVDEAALVGALRAGVIAGAVFDVCATEPLPVDSPLLGCPGLVLTAHLAGAAIDVVRHHTNLLCADLARLSAGHPRCPAPTPTCAERGRVRAFVPTPRPWRSPSARSRGRPGRPAPGRARPR